LLQQYLDLPDTTVDVWLELHDRKAADRLKLTAGIPGWADLLFLEGNRWGYPSSSEERLLRRLGLIDGPRKCLWLEVWYREVWHEPAGLKGDCDAALAK